MGVDGSSPAIGFLTVLEDEAIGMMGGYLVLNAAGRPLEFHCTAPLKPSKAQQILYGPTLRPYLYGEQIGQLLVARAKASTRLVCVDQSPCLSVREHVELPVALVLEPPPGDATSDTESDSPTYRLHDSHAAGVAGNDAASKALVPFHWGKNRLAVDGRHPRDAETASTILSPLVEFDLGEPFERIRQALEEAQRSGR